MITVNVWPPMLSGIQSPEDAAIELLSRSNPYPTFQDKLKAIGVDTISDLQRLTGHTSLTVQAKNGEVKYLSYWPSPNKSELATIATSALVVPGVFVDSYEEDRKAMSPKRGGVVDGWGVKISGLNEDAVVDYIEDVRGRNKKEIQPFLSKLLFSRCGSA